MDCFDLQQKKKEKNDELPHPIAMKQSRKVVKAAVSLADRRFWRAHPCTSQGISQLNENVFSNRIKQIGLGLAFILFPVLFIFAFAVHPNLLHPQLLGPEELILRSRDNELLQLQHVLVTLNTTLLIVAALHFMRLLDPKLWRLGWFSWCRDRHFRRHLSGSG